jgi:hypothetical protein
MRKEDGHEQDGHDRDHGSGSDPRRTPGGWIEGEAEEVAEKPDHQRHEEEDGPDHRRGRARDLRRGSRGERGGRRGTTGQEGAAEAEECDDRHQGPCAERCQWGPLRAPHSHEPYRYGAGLR